MIASSRKLAAFDLDGTLNQTHLYAVPATLKALEELSIFSYTPEQIIKQFGASGEDYSKWYLPDSTEQERRAFLDRCAYYECEFIKTHRGSFKGIPELLKYLKQQNILTAVCSNASHRYISLVLNELDLMQYIDFIQPIRWGTTKIDSLRLLIENLRPQKAVMVGDRYFDWQAAQKNGLSFIGCGYGYCNGELENCPVVVSSPDQISDWIDRFLA